MKYSRTILFAAVLVLLPFVVVAQMEERDTTAVSSTDTVAAEMDSAATLRSSREEAAAEVDSLEVSVMAGGDIAPVVDSTTIPPTVENRGTPAAGVDPAAGIEADVFEGPGDSGIMVFPLPDVGIFFVRYGEPGAVQITSSVESPAPDSISSQGAQARLPDAETIARIIQEELARYQSEHMIDRGKTRPVATESMPSTTIIPSTSTHVIPGSPSDVRSPTSVGTRPADSTQSAGHVQLPAPGVSAMPGPRPSQTDSESVRQLEPQVVREFALREFQCGSLLRSNLVIFETDESTLIPYSRLVLDVVGDIMHEFPDMVIRIEGHADQRGNEEYNLQLSQRRADSVREYFIETIGIAPDRLESIGYGESRPLVAATSTTALTLNRRAEFRVLNPEEVFPR